MRRSSFLVAAAVSATLALTASAHAAARALPAALGRAVSPTVVRPAPPTSDFIALPVEIPIQRESDEGEFRALKRGGAARTTGGRELVFDANTKPAPRADALVSTFDGLSQYYSVPYDAAIAVNPSQALVMTNNQFGVYDKATGQQLAYALYLDFFGNFAGGGFDPKCFYDATAGRFVMVVVEVAYSPDRAVIDLAVSQTSDATGAWFKYSFDATLLGSNPTTTWSDYPGLGYDDLHVFVTADQIRFSDTMFDFARIRCWSKLDLYAGAPASFVDFGPVLRADGRKAHSIEPARSLTTTPTGRFLSSRANGGTAVTRWTTSGVFPLLSLSAPESLAIGAYDVPHDAVQPDTAILISTGDCRMQDVTWTNGTWYAGFTEKSPADTALSALRYLEITDGGAVTRDVTYATDDYSLCYPAVTPDAAGNVALVFERCSAAEYVSMYHSRLPAGGAFEPSQLVRAGVGAHTRERWGDYSGVANDPADAGLVWIFGGWGNVNNRWATYIASVRPSVPGSLDVLPLATADPLRFDVVLYAHEGRSHLAFTLAQPQAIDLALFDVTGRRLKTLARGQQAAGRHELEWDGRDEHGRRVGSGMLWARLEAAGRTQVRRVIVLR